MELESTEGLLLGQHVYMQMDAGEDEIAGISISSAFVAFEEDGSTYIWAENRGKLEKRPVTLGEYNMMNDTYQILEGLTEEDYIAFPDYELCHEGAPTTHSEMTVESDEGMEGAAVEEAVIVEGEVA